MQQQQDQQQLPSAPAAATTAVLERPLPAEAAAESPAASAADRVWSAAERLQPLFAAIDRELVSPNLRRVQRAMAAVRVGPHHFAGSTGYGKGDLGRAALDEVVAAVMGAEAAAVRGQFVSGTHAIAAALFGVLRPGDELLAVAGPPYDTLEEVVGLRGSPGLGSLAEWGVSYSCLPLAPGGGIDWEALPVAVGPRTRVALLQRSCGYALRPTLGLADIQRAAEVIKAANPGCVVAVDNCYGEFTDVAEPPAVGADICMGSLIKSPGGTLVAGGGYVAGREDLVAAAIARLTAPGIGLDAGCVDGQTLRLMFQGLYLAPMMVGEGLKGGRLVAEVLSGEGYRVVPPPGRADPWSAITAVELGSREAMITMCRAIQKTQPVGSYVYPEPGVTAGYGDEVIFADGSFIDGSTAELTADGPIRPPYVVYWQGGNSWLQHAYALEAVLEQLGLAER